MCDRVRCVRHRRACGGNRSVPDHGLRACPGPERSGRHDPQHGCKSGSVARSEDRRRSDQHAHRPEWWDLRQEVCIPHNHAGLARAGAGVCGNYGLDSERIHHRGGCTGRIRRCRNWHAGHPPPVQDAAGKHISYTYDPDGNLTKTIDQAGNSVLIKYDALGGKHDTTDPDLGN
jgi:YD repeat-containing protein